jgi:Bacterial Ig-like domain (group 3)
MKGCHHVKFKIKAALAGVAGAATLALTGAGLLAIAAPAYASAPPYEPDANSAPPYGNIVFYNANGQEVTSGTSLTNPFAYAIGTTAPDHNATKATLYFADPVSGELPANWNSTTEAGPTTDTSGTTIGSSTPADIAGYAGLFPIVNASAANITTWIPGNTSSTTTGYVDTIEVRLQDSGTGGAGNASGTYWSTDIVYNTGSSATTLDGVSVPAGGWAQVFPNVTASTTTLTTSATGGQLATGSPITLTANVSPSLASGDLVQFWDGTTFLADSTVTGGTATYSYTPAAGTHTYQAYFVPDAPGDETGANSTTAAITGGSASSSVQVVDSAPLIGTSTALSATSSSIAYGASDTFTATVTGSDGLAAGVAGTVQFFNGATSLGSSPTTVSGTTGTATLSTTALPTGTDNITATFTPTDTAYGSSTSPGVSVTVAAPAACSLTGSSCSDTQNIEVTVNPGTLTITTPYTATNPFVLPALTLSADGTYLSSSAPFPATTNPQAQQIVVTSTLSGDPVWSLSVAATQLSNGSGGTIPASGLGLTGGTLLDGGTASGDFPGSITFTNLPSVNPSSNPADNNNGTNPQVGGPGLSATPQTWATTAATPGGNGTAVMDGTLSLYASTSTPAGTYTGTITFSVS